MPPTYTEEQVFPVDQSEQKHHHLKWLLVVLALVIVGSVCWYFFVYIRSTPPTATPTAVSTKPTEAEIQAALTKLAGTSTPKVSPVAIRKQLDALAKKGSDTKQPTEAEIQAALSAQTK